MLSAHTVSPLEGIKEALEDHDVEVQNCDGVTGASFKYLPIIDSLMERFYDFTEYLEKLDNPTQEFKDLFKDVFDGEPGALIEFWNESPTEDFLKKDAVVKNKTPEPVWLTRTRSSNCFFSDGVVSLANIVGNRLLLIIFWRVRTQPRSIRQPGFGYVFIFFFAILVKFFFFWRI